MEVPCHKKHALALQRILKINQHKLVQGFDQLLLLSRKMLVFRDNATRCWYLSELFLVD